MNRRSVILGSATALVLAGTTVGLRSWWQPQSAIAATAKPTDEKQVLVEVATATRKSLPVRLSSFGTVTPVASVAVKARLETAITEVHFEDGADVKQGDLLFSLDSRQTEIDIRRVEAVIAAEQARLEQAERDVLRSAELIAKNVGTPLALSNAKTQVAISHANVETSVATLDNLRLQLDHARIRAPISGRISAANVKAGNITRFNDSTPLATIVQMAPVYVTFTVPQHDLPDLREALAARTASIDVEVPGARAPVSGKVSMIDHTVDSANGLVTVRAIMSNEDKLLWPGTLVTVQLTLRSEDIIALPSYVIKAGQKGPYVYVVEDGRAKMRQVKIARVFGGESVVGEGLQPGEVVVTDGHLLIKNDTRVASRPIETRTRS